VPSSEDSFNSFSLYKSILSSKQIFERETSHMNGLLKNIPPLTTKIITLAFANLEL
jgi:hypothetical protein